MGASGSGEGRLSTADCKKMGCAPKSDRRVNRVCAGPVFLPDCCRHARRFFHPNHAAIGVPAGPPGQSRGGDCRRDVGGMGWRPRGVQPARDGGANDAAAAECADDSRPEARPCLDRPRPVPHGVPPKELVFAMARCDAGYAWGETKSGQGERGRRTAGDVGDANAAVLARADGCDAGAV